MDPLPSIVTMLVSNALDDLDAERIDTEAALRVVAEQAWIAGYHAGQADGYTLGQEQAGTVAVDQIRPRNVGKAQDERDEA